MLISIHAFISSHFRMRFLRILLIAMYLVFAVLLATSMAADTCKNEDDCIKVKVSCDKGKLLKCVNALCVCVSVNV
ncbi:unnamed protein product [Callosobruchus maculatus]|uniref:Late nodulin n=1 Tax=Callosobruchus maculatus TaxID=64391 RepID=A0A653CFG8_CALMS|nr:unnamed protein product [Callosobruchus maculatus]